MNCIVVSVSQTIEAHYKSVWRRNLDFLPSISFTCCVFIKVAAVFKVSHFATGGINSCDVCLTFVVNLFVHLSPEMTDVCVFVHLSISVCASSHLSING